MDNKVLNGILGLCVGDALGVPVEFVSRRVLNLNPVKDMQGYGSHNQAPGTWSDDSSLTLCLAESLCKGYDIYDIANKFHKWLYEGYWTATGEVFDVGGTTRMALGHIKKVRHPSLAGGRGEHDNGNGSLMRILPIAFYVKNMKNEKKFSIISEVSSITHGNIKSVIACSIYVEIAINLIKGQDIMDAYENMKPVILEYYKKYPELESFRRILYEDISDVQEKEISSSGYVIDTLEASLWCCLNNSSYKEIVLKAINLGEDTDTTGAVAGGLAGLMFGVKNIPKKWLNVLARRDDIIELCEILNKKLDNFL